MIDVKSPTMGIIEEDHDDLSERITVTRKLPTVKKDDVVDIGKALRYRLKDQ